MNLASLFTGPAELFSNGFFTDVVLGVYFVSLLLLFVFGAHGFLMVYH